MNGQQKNKHNWNFIMLHVFNLLLSQWTDKSRTDLKNSITE